MPPLVTAPPAVGQPLVRTNHGGVVVYQSPRLLARGVPHGFSTRHGGVSPAPFDSLNLGLLSDGPQDDLANLRENRARLLAACGLQGHHYRSVTQVHGRAVVRADADLPAGTCGDALVTSDRSAVVGVKTADCCPILLATANGSAVAAVHAGWRGCVGGVIEAAAAALGSPAELIAAIGPCIGVGAFEVGPEVAAAFRDRFGADAPVRPSATAAGKLHVDLPAAAVLALLAAGVAADRIDCGRICTFSYPNEFFSHRRDNGVTGRMLNVIGPAASAHL